VKHTSDHGTIEYRLPNGPDILKILAHMGYNSKTLSKGLDVKNDLMFIAQLIEALELLITKVDITLDDVKIKTFSKLIEQPVMLTSLSEIAAVVADKMNLEGKKKPS
jgi:hypothetical protein